MKDGKVRSESTAGAVQLWRDGATHLWGRGDREGRLKTYNLLPPAVQKILNPWWQMIPIKRAGGKVGEEKLEKVDCDIYALGDPTLTVWFSKTNQLPVKATLTEVRIISATGKIDTKYTEVTTWIFKEIEANTKIPDVLFEPPNDVAFREN